MSLILTIFVIVFLTELVSWIGQSVLLELAYALYQRIFNASAVSRQRKLQAEILASKKELLQTSAQDQFARWAKLRRIVDKGLADLEKHTSKSAFALKFKGVLWMSTTGVQFIVGWWYRGAAVFYLPPGWFGPLAWTLALPFAPKGAVSVGVWQMACRRVIRLGERVVKDLAKGNVKSAEPVDVAAQSTTGEKAKAKKDL
ncbi:hypothetical protein PLICRDRAFT_27563 [Plicaturopsis crispa FD-325 SS-3]|nr:hypothetical protein PLICRDRAFT_27563 [Plicaturopsis crispa FD-325 SS-3]